MAQNIGFRNRMIALGYLVSRYVQVSANAWKHRREGGSVRRRNYELEFLPAALELAETPVHPAPYWTMYTVSGLVVVVAMLAAFGHLDIVVVAKGKVLPDERVKMIQPAVTGVVRRILVSDGQRVSAGQTLVELDPVQADADVAKTRTIRVAAALSAARADALLTAQLHRDVPRVQLPPNASLADKDRVQSLVLGAFNEYNDKVQAERAELARREAELEATNHDIEGLQKTSPLARQEALDYKLLAEKKYVATHDYLEKEQTAIQHEQDLLAKQSHGKELLSAIAQQRDVIAQTESEFRRDQLDALEKATQELRQDTDDENKAVSHAGEMLLTTPVAGTVQHLTLHTLGGVVTTAQNLMEVVPDDALEVEADVENKDVGFVRSGQAAAVKVEAFPYSRFGYLEGTVRSISNDATQDNKHTLSFVTRIHLASNKMLVDNHWIELVPGMAVTVEIRTGRRTVLKYFLDPILRNVTESLHER